MRRRKKKSRRMVRAGLLLLILLLSGCADRGREEKSEQSVHTEASTETRKGEVVEKEVLKDHVSEDKTIYARDAEDSVVTMYLTVRSGNEEDHTNHSWTEVNAHSAYYYEDNQLARYNCEAILQVGDENGPVEGEFGYGETVPNAAVQIRGQTSSELEQKNYKIRIKKGKGEWRGQRTLALNKHVFDPFRFTNKLCYDLIKEVPQMIGARTQFVHLYVKDETEGGNGQFTDYGLYTQVEQMNKTFLKNHGLDSKGYLYKVNFFEWYRYADVLKEKDDPDYDEKTFEEYLEIKGRDDHEKLLTLLDTVNDYSIPIGEIVEQYFEVDNLCYWAAFHILTGNHDVGSRNFYLYSPLNSEKWYILSWDNDSSFMKTFNRRINYSEGDSWERGITQFTHIVLFNRMFKEEKYRRKLDDAVNDLRKNYLTDEKISSKAHRYASVVKPYLFRQPDEAYSRADAGMYDELVEAMVPELQGNVQNYRDSLEKPWPFYVGTPYEEGGQMLVDWDAAYDIDGESITYSFTLAGDYDFRDVILHKKGIRIPGISFDTLPPGEYFIRVRAKNTSGYEQDCYDYYATDQGKIYGAFRFIVQEDGSIVVG
ncbi:MAG: CotH kinase family protein [Hominisplanchenecus sp.]